MASHKKTLNIILWNVTRVKNKTIELHSSSQTITLTLLSLQKPGLPPKKLSKYQITGYTRRTVHNQVQRN